MNYYLNQILGAVLLFLPAFVGNGAPVIFKRLGWLKRITRPIDGGGKLGGERILGENKTYMGLIAGAVGGAAGGLLQVIFLNSTGWQIDYSWWTLYFIAMGAGMGIAAILGDLIKSFFKRRLKIKPGDPWFVLDQIDYLVGAYLFLLLFRSFDSTWLFFLIALVLSVPVHFLLNVLAYKLGWKKVWW